MVLVCVFGRDAIWVSIDFVRVATGHICCPLWMSLGMDLAGRWTLEHGWHLRSWCEVTLVFVHQRQAVVQQLGCAAGLWRSAQQAHKLALVVKALGCHGLHQAATLERFCIVVW